MRIKAVYLVIILTLILTIVHTWPAVLNFNSKFMGTGTDFYHWAWTFWALNKGYFNSTHIIAYPFEYNIFNSPIRQTTILLGGIFVYLFSYAFAYNFVAFLSFILSGAGMFLLVKYLTKNNYASTISAVLYAFSTAHLEHSMYHIEIMSIQWFPFFALYLEKLLKESSYKNSLLTSVFFCFTFLTHPHFGVFALIYLCLRLIYEFARKKIIVRKKFVHSFALFLILSVCVLTATMWQYLNSSVERERDEGLVNYYAVNPVFYFVPSPSSSLFGNFFKGLFGNKSVAETASYLGIINIFCLIAYLLKRKFTKESLFLFLSGVFFMVLSFGTEINGFPLPAKIFYLYFPFFSSMRTICRFNIMALLCFSALSGFVLKDIFEKHRSKANLILVSLIFVSVFDSLMAPFPLADAEIPDFYSLLKNDTENFAIIDLPIFTSGTHYAGLYMYYQTAHEKPIMGVYGAYYTKEFDDFVMNSNLAVLQYNNFLSGYRNTAKAGGIFDTLKELNVKYVIYHNRTDCFSEAQYTAYYSYLKNIMNKTSIYKDEKIEAWEVY